MITRGIDVSEYQAGLSLKAAQAAGAQFVIARATRGPDLWKDREYLRFRSEAKALRLPFAAYHFVGGPSTITAQADLAASVVSARTPIMLDLESSERWGAPSYRSAVALRGALEDRGRRVTLLYLPRWYWEQIGRPDLAADGWSGLVSSRYMNPAKVSLMNYDASDRHPGWQPYGGMHPTLIQYTDGARIPGYTANTVDGDAFRGSLSDLHARGVLRFWDTPTGTVDAMTWRVAASLQTLLAEVNAVAPHRSTLSDGSIGDPAHASRTSDHNPWVTVGGVGVVRARDFTHDVDGGPDARLDADELARFLVPLLGKHPALGSGAYIIRNRRIISTDRLAEGWRSYSGSNPHEKHLHLSVTTNPAGFDSTAPWGWETAHNQEEDPMAGPLTDEVLAQIADAVWTRKFPAGRTAGQMLGGIHARTLLTRDLAKRAVKHLGSTVSEDDLADALSKALADVERPE